MSSFSCKIMSSDCAIPLGVEIWLDNQCIFNLNHVTESVLFSYEIEDKHVERCLRWVLKNKLSAHTHISSTGEIEKDATISISNILIDGIDCTYIVLDNSMYSHNFNGTQHNTVAKFYGTMGSNGTVELNFTTPFYLWLLEYM